MPRPKRPAHQLTERERQVHDYICQGMANAQIAAALNISPKTLESHIRNIYEKQAEPLRARGPARRIEYLLSILSCGCAS
jgi:FixJ family two-component response regulator